jgi:hypothetical protein
MAFGNPFYSNQRLRAIQDSPQTQRARDMTEARRQFQDEDKMFIDFPSRTAYDQAVYERAQGIATNRQSARPAPLSSPLAQSPNLNFPITEGGTRGMDRETIAEKARGEEMRLAGQQVFGLAAQPTNFENAGVKKESGGVIQTPYGVMSTSAPVGQKEFETSTAGIQGYDRPERYATTPSGNFQRQLSGADDRALAMAGMAERGGDIRRNLETQERNRYFAFRQGLEERGAQKALTPSFGTTVGREATMRGAQALVQAERWKQAQQGRSPMSRSPLRAMGMDFLPTSSGQYAPVQRMGPSGQAQSPFSRTPSSVGQTVASAPQPMAGMPLGLSSPTGMGDISSSFRAFDEQYQSPLYQFPFGGFGG